MAARFFALAMAVVVAVAIADAIANPNGTKALTNAAISAQKVALNAELGKPS